MSAKPYRPHNLCFILIAVPSLFLMLGCAPCCGWWGNGLDLNGGSGATVSGTAYITMNGQKSPVPNIDVTLSTNENTTSKYSTTTNSSGYFKLKNVAPGTYFIRIAGGDLGWTDTITVKKDTALDLGDIQLHPTLPPPNADTGKYPATPEDVLRAYYKAINARDYNPALSFWSLAKSPLQADTLKAQFEPYVKNIEVVSIERRTAWDHDGESVYFITFSAEYIKHYEAGSEDLQRMHALKQINGKWMIVDVGTG